jgi:hypothetical protein
LNNLYGFFGRSFNLIETRIIKNDVIVNISKDQTIKNIYEINNEYSVVLINEIKDQSEYSFIKSNVAIASAVTSYARIEMIKIKIYCIKNKIKIKKIPLLIFGD